MITVDLNEVCLSQAITPSHIRHRILESDEALLALTSLASALASSGIVPAGLKLTLLQLVP
jgi:hypothetical protein